MYIYEEHGAVRAGAIPRKLSPEIIPFHIHNINNRKSINIHMVQTSEQL